MKPIIGIITRDYKSKNKHNIKYVYSDIIDSITKSGGIPIGITNDKSYIDICDGFIFQGGDNIIDGDIELLRILYQKNKPVLGICLGMQEMGRLFNGKEIKIDNHNISNYHEVNIKKDTLLYKIINTPKILVNSRHKYMITDVNTTITGMSSDNVIEAIEDTNKRFFLGLEWHPENMYSYDLNSRKIFDYFIKICNDK